jgi:cation transport protein ChaC
MGEQGAVMAAGGDELWIFAYGSLMWRPDFDFVERRKARLAGYHRALCISSNHWRGTPERPGLVLGLDRGGSCVGIAFRIAAETREATLAAVRAREMIGGVYHEIWPAVLLDDGRRQVAVTYVADRNHHDYAGKLGREAMLARVRHSVGVAGPNVDYVRNTAAHLQQLGVVDPHLAFLVAALDVAPGRHIP